MQPEIITKRMVGECSSSVTDSTFTGTKSGIKLLIFALEQKLKTLHWNGIQKTFLFSYIIHSNQSKLKFFGPPY